MSINKIINSAFILFETNAAILKLANIYFNWNKQSRLLVSRPGTRLCSDKMRPLFSNAISNEFSVFVSTNISLNNMLDWQIFECGSNVHSIYFYKPEKKMYRNILNLSTNTMCASLFTALDQYVSLWRFRFLPYFQSLSTLLSWQERTKNIQYHLGILLSASNLNFRFHNC